MFFMIKKNVFISSVNNITISPFIFGAKHNIYNTNKVPTETQSH